ncbi:hypothetical protein [Mariniblastus fucicola]|uniref:Uncharacterized protein n=1 Tax=Mariniblastus fucicola TaxID=980251 RepID=A0A5B9PBE3_9BACT|nr:hypothetical protein [Mariniblastus fucicola]QEG22252.1 hypothetical protein MFFC18_21280 [Mariniblastus fucicola]
MRFNLKRTLCATLACAVCTLAFFAIQYSQIESPRVASAAESSLANAVATLPLGSSAPETEKHIGSHPDSTVDEDAILVNPSCMYDASSAQGLAIAEPQPFTFRKWKRGDLNVSLAFASDGKIAAKLIWLDN